VHLRSAVLAPVRSSGLFAALVAAILIPSPADAVKRRAFVTSISGTANLSSWPGAGGLTGLDAGDNICRVRAITAGLPNGATYRAWLSNGTTDAFCHIQGLPGTREDACGGLSQPAGPWYLVNGATPFTGALDGLAGPARAIYRPVMLDEFGTVLPSLSASATWTGTTPQGTRDLDNCAGWTSGSSAVNGEFGYALTADSSWTSWSSTSCNATMRLLCFEPGTSEVVYAPYWLPGAMVFVTSALGQGDLGAWPEAGAATGIEAGDQICRNLAADAGLPAPGSFLAWLSTTDVDAVDRVFPHDAPFRRPDGMIVANDLADLLDGSLDTSIHVDETGAFSMHSAAWTGTNADGTAHASNCQNWTSENEVDGAMYGIAGTARIPNWTQTQAASCGDYSFRLICISNAVTLFWDGFESATVNRWTEMSQ
jgi:hypothetical protein